MILRISMTENKPKISDLTDIQEKTIPVVLHQKEDVVALTKQEQEKQRKSSNHYGKYY